MTEAEAQHGIFNSADHASVNKTGMTLDGDFTFYGTSMGIYSNYHLTLKGDITGEGKRCGICVLNGRCDINGGNIKAFGTDSDSYGIRISGNVNISGSTQSVIAQASSHSGIMTHGGLNINNADDQNVQIIEPVGAVIKTCTENTYYKGVYEADGETAAERVIIKQFVKYDLRLGSTQVTTANQDDILHDGKASFDPDSCTLTLNNAVITDHYADREYTYAIYSELDANLTVRGSGTIGTSAIKSGIVNAEGYVTLDGDFTISSSEYGISAAKGVTFSGGSTVINGTVASVFGMITVSSHIARLEIKTDLNYAVGSLAGVEIAPEVTYVLPKNGTVSNNVIADENGNPATHVILEGNAAAYDLWLGKTQVTYANKGDILGDGKAEFDPATNTLTLNEPVITGVYESDEDDDSKLKIYSYLTEPLTVTGSYHMDDEGVYCGLLASSDLTLDGDFTFRGTHSGIQLPNDSVLNITGGSLLAEGTGFGFGIVWPEAINIGSNVTRVEFKGGSNALMADKIDMAPPLAILSPVGCYHKGTVFVYSDGYTPIEDLVIGQKKLILGDVNFDGVVDINDATYVQMAAAGLIEFDENQKAAADVNGDGVVDINDATYIQMFAAGIITSFEKS